MVRTVSWMRPAAFAALAVCACAAVAAPKVDFAAILADPARPDDFTTLVANYPRYNDEFTLDDDGAGMGRLHVGRYRVIYEIGTDVISVRRVDRVSTGISHGRGWPTCAHAAARAMFGTGHDRAAVPVRRGGLPAVLPGAVS